MSVSNGHGPVPVTGSTSATGWWLVDIDSRVVAGPFPSRVDAALAGFSSSPRDELDELVPAHGNRRDDGTLAPRFSPDDRAWLAHLSDQLDRLADDWDALIDDADPLTGLVCEVAAAVAEAGLPLHDCAGRTPSRQLGGVCLTPAPGEQGVLVTWTQHDRMALGRVRGHAADLAAQEVMNHAVAGVLTAFGFLVEPFGHPGTSSAAPAMRPVSLNGNDFPLSGPVVHAAGVDTYTHGHADPVLQSHRWRTVENSAAHLAPHLRPGLDLLDVGCGPGTITVDLAARVAPGRVVGLDVSPAPLAEARALAERSGVAVEFAVGDVYALDAADDSYDVVHAHQVLQHLTDPVAALREMARVCRPGGLVAVRDVDYATFTWFPADPGLDRWLEVYYAVARHNGAEPDAGRRLLSWAHAAGLRDVTATASSWCYASPAEREWWGNSWAGRATASSFAEQAVGYGLATTAELADLAAAWHRWRDADDGWLGMLHGQLLIKVP